MHDMILAWLCDIKQDIFISFNMHDMILAWLCDIRTDSTNNRSQHNFIETITVEEIDYSK